MDLIQEIHRNLTAGITEIYNKSKVLTNLMLQILLMI